MGVFGELTGTAGIGKWVGNTRRDVAGSMGRIREAYEAARGPKKPKRPKYEAPKDADGFARYAAAYAHYRTDARKEALILRSTHKSFWSYLWLMVAVVIGASIYTRAAPDFSAPYLRELTIFAAWSNAAPLLALAIKASRINRMVRNRYCETWAEFFKSGDWTPVRTRSQA